MRESLSELGGVRRISGRSNRNVGIGGGSTVEKNGKWGKGSLA